MNAQDYLFEVIGQFRKLVPIINDSDHPKRYVLAHGVQQQLAALADLEDRWTFDGFEMPADPVEVPPAPTDFYRCPVRISPRTGLEYIEVHFTEEEWKLLKDHCRAEQMSEGSLLRKALRALLEPMGDAALRHVVTCYSMGGVSAIATERARQQGPELKRTAEHDDEHPKGTLAQAAHFYLSAYLSWAGLGSCPKDHSPWHDEHGDPPHIHSPRDALRKAGSLIAAEYDRYERNPEGEYRPLTTRGKTPTPGELDRKNPI